VLLRPSGSNDLAGLDKHVPAAYRLFSYAGDYMGLMKSYTTIAPTRSYTIKASSDEVLVEESLPRRT